MSLVKGLKTSLFYNIKFSWVITLQTSVIIASNNKDKTLKKKEKKSN